jgi:carbon monoxide dehydrogenase subunit G
MESVTLSRTIEVSPDAVREAMSDIGPFTEAAGFDEVTVEGETIEVVNRVGVATIQLTLQLVDEPDSDLAYEQREGIFREMTTVYNVSETPAGCEVTATTEFALDVALIGDVLDSTVIKRQRRKELSAQLDWLEERVVE